MEADGNGKIFIILISGKKQNGKDTLGGYIREHLTRGLNDDDNLRVITLRAFADTLKSAAQDLFGLTTEQLYSQNEKEIVDKRYNKTPRVILQEFGTKMREIYPNIWIDLTYQDIDVDTDFCDKFTIITDCRYKNEIEQIKRLTRKDNKDVNILTFRINRPSLPNNDPHISEIDLDDYEHWDEVIINDGTLEDLEEKAKCLVNKYFSWR